MPLATSVKWQPGVNGVPGSGTESDAPLVTDGSEGDTSTGYTRTTGTGISVIWDLGSSQNVRRIRATGVVGLWFIDRSSNGSSWSSVTSGGEGTLNSSFNINSSGRYWRFMANLSSTLGSAYISDFRLFDVNGDQYATTISVSVSVARAGSSGRAVAPSILTDSNLSADRATGAARAPDPVIQGDANGSVAKASSAGAANDPSVAYGAGPIVVPAEASARAPDAVAGDSIGTNVTSVASSASAVSVTVGQGVGATAPRSLCTGLAKAVTITTDAAPSPPSASGSGDAVAVSVSIGADVPATTSTASGEALAPAIATGAGAVAPIARSGGRARAPSIHTDSLISADIASSTARAGEAEGGSSIDAAPVVTSAISAGAAKAAAVITSVARAVSSALGFSLARIPRVVARKRPYMTYPAGSDVIDFLATIGTVADETYDFDNAVLDLIRRFERGTDRPGFNSDTSDVALRFDPPDGRSGDFLLRIPDFYQVSSVTIGYTKTVAGTLLEEEVDYWLQTDELGGPYTAIKFEKNPGCKPQSVRVVGKRGVAANCPPDVWRAIVKTAAGEYLMHLQSTGKGERRRKNGEREVEFDVAGQNTSIAELCGALDKVKGTNRRVW